MQGPEERQKGFKEWKEILKVVKEEG